jgi:hypothetical protein
VIRKDGGTYQESLPERVAYLEMTNGCPCRCHTSMSSAEGSPAKTSPTPAREQGSTGNARVFGPSTPDSFANYDPDTSSWRTSQLSLLEDSGECLLTWPRAGMTRSGIASRLRPSAPLTGGTGSGLLHTPTAKANQASPSMRDRDAGSWFRKEPLPTPEASNTKARAMRSGGRPPRDFLKPLWATPTAWLGRRPSQATGDPERWHDPNRSNELSDQVAATGTTGSLNPTWVEGLMGFPIGWSDTSGEG